MQRFYIQPPSRAALSPRPIQKIRRGPDANPAGIRKDLLVHEKDATVELTMEVVVGSDPIRGTTRVAGGEQREFWGWLELAEIVQFGAATATGVPSDRCRPTTITSGKRGGARAT
jgi:hypothetical protein